MYRWNMCYKTVLLKLEERKPERSFADYGLWFRYMKMN